MSKRQKPPRLSAGEMEIMQMLWRSGPVTLSEAGLLALAGSTATNLTVALASSHTSRLQVPSEVTIPAGAASVRFDLTLVDNTTPDPGEIRGAR